MIVLERCANRPEPDCLAELGGFNTNNQYCDNASWYCNSGDVTNPTSWGYKARYCCPVSCGICEESTEVFECTCSNGTPATGSDCLGGEQCSECNRYYHSSSFTLYMAHSTRVIRDLALIIYGQ